jgi:hypothetical protein
MDRWLSKDLQTFGKELWLQPDSACRQYFNQDYLETLLREHASGRYDRQRQIYCLLSFEIWHRIFVAGQSYQDLAT